MIVEVIRYATRRKSMPRGVEAVLVPSEIETIVEFSGFDDARQLLASVPTNVERVGYVLRFDPNGDFHD